MTSPLLNPFGTPTLTTNRWADQVLDLRQNQHEPTPEHLPARFGRFHLDGAPDSGNLNHLNGWRVEFHSPTWPNETGYEIAVFVPPTRPTVRTAIIYQDVPDGVPNKRIAVSHLGLARTIGERTIRPTEAGLRIAMTHAAILNPTLWLDGTDLAPPEAMQRMPLWVSPHWPTWSAARPWIDAGFTSPQHALGWVHTFTDPIAAYGWRDSSLGTPEQCRALSDAGWRPLQGKRLAIALLNNSRDLAMSPHAWAQEQSNALATVTELTRAGTPERCDPERILLCLAAGMTATEIADLVLTGRFDSLDRDVLTAMSALRRRTAQNA